MSTNSFPILRNQGIFSDGGVWADLQGDPATHMPPPGFVPEGASLIVDLGCFSGLTTGIYAEKWPDAKIIGVDMGDDVGTARENAALFGDRVQIIQSAVGYPKGPRHAFFPNDIGTVNTVYTSDISVFERGQWRSVDVLTLDEILALAGVDAEPIDFLKVDIEGSEREVLQDGGCWSERALCILVEVHGKDGYGHDQAISDMEALGFKVTLASNMGHLVGVR